MTSMPDPASALKPVPAAMSRAVSAGGHTRARRAVTEAAQVPGSRKAPPSTWRGPSVVFERTAEVFLRAGTVMGGRPHQAHMLEVP